MKKVLIITYYWPPSGGAGVQRWLKFVKYLKDFNWEPIVYTPENPEISAFDNSLQRDIPDNLVVLKQRIWEPYNWYKKLIGQKKEQKVIPGFISESKKIKFTEKLSIWVRGNFFIPDARKFWIKPSANYLIQYLKSNPIDVIVSTGPPHSMHLIALKLKLKLNIPWIADFRDPWTNIDFYNQLMLTKIADNKHKRLEQKVLKNADKIVTVSWNWAKDFEELGAKNVEIITNGFDEDDFLFTKEKYSKYFLITHIGSLNKDRNSESFWETLGDLCKENAQFKSDLKVEFIGKTDYSVFESLKKNSLEFCAEKIDYMPHKQVLKHSAQASLLLLLLNNTPNVMGIIPGKIFEYLAAERPILCIGLTIGDSAKIIRETQTGKTIDFYDKEEMKNTILNYYQLYKNGQLKSQGFGIEKYSRKKLTEKLANELNKITG